MADSNPSRVLQGLPVSDEPERSSSAEDVSQGKWQLQKDLVFHLHISENFPHFLRVRCKAVVWSEAASV